MKKRISITAISSISPLGRDMDTVWENYMNDGSYIVKKMFGDREDLVAAIAEEDQKEIAAISEQSNKYKNLDNSVLYALYASRKACEQANWDADAVFGINIGSSRGATSLFEKYHEYFLLHHKSETLSSPTTTLGNISSWVAHDLKSKGPEISHSITCATALHSLLNGVAWINSGMTDKFLVGGSEAPLTPFTIAQMQALKIYSKKSDTAYPCNALDLDKSKNTMVLGEGAAMACLEEGEQANALALIEGIGYATEILTHGVSISTEAECFQDAMRMALGTTKPEEVDVIITHTPGTVKGDKSEINAIKVVFNDTLPAITTNKWKIGHALGASGMLSVELGVLMIKHQQYIPVPYLKNQKEPQQINKVLVNAVGFGGNAVSVLLSVPKN